MKKVSARRFDYKEKYLSGPRTMKDPSSEEWAFQTIYTLKMYWESLARYDDEFEKVKGEIEAQRVWERYPPGKPYGSEDEMFRKELGIGLNAAEKKLEKVKKAKQKAEAAVPLPERGQSGNSKAGKKLDQGSIRTLVRGETQSYLARRLKRDRPDIFSKLETYKSVRAAALEAGIVRPRVSIEPTPSAFAKYIIKHFSESQIGELLQQLSNHDI